MNKRIIVAAASVVAFLASGVAFAAWTATGTGSGNAQATTAEALTTTAATTTGQLYPGGTGDVEITINNSNDYPVRVTAIAGNGPITAAGGIGTCAITGVSFADQSGLTLDIPANDSETFTLSGAASMSNDSENGCQGAVFTIPVSITGASNAS